MAQDSNDEAAPRVPRRKRRYFRRALLLLSLLLLGAALLAWFERENIADDYITDMLAAEGVEARYTIEEIGPQRQVLTDIVIGDPARPALTIERAELVIEPRFGFPGVHQLILHEPRLYGTFVDGDLSFGELDSLLFTGAEGPFEFPDIELVVRDGRALIEGDLGPVALKLAGEGHLRGGFAGEVAAVAPSLAFAECSADDARLYGRIAVDAERPQFEGPLRFAELACEGSGFAMHEGGVQTSFRADRNLSDFEGEASLAAGDTMLGDARIAAVEGEADFAWRGGNLVSRYTIEGRDLRTGAFGAAQLALDGSLRAINDFERIEVQAELDGSNMRLGPQAGQALVSAREATSGTLLAPLIERIGRGLDNEMRNSSLTAGFTARGEEGRLSLVVPEARLRGDSGESLLLLSRGRMGFAGEDLPLFSGNFATGGRGLPRINGRMEQNAAGALVLRMQMREYSADSSRITLPDLRLARADNGSLSIEGRVRASGPLPGGTVQNLILPLSGSFSPRAGLRMWPGCAQIRFDRLTLSNLALDHQALTLCPPEGSAILRYGDSGLALAAGVPSLSLRGTLGETPIALASGPVGFAWPGVLTAQRVEVALGPAGTASRFTLTDLAAQFEQGIGGDFAGTDVLLNGVPLDVLGASGEWTYADGRLMLENARFTLEDRQADQRFEPLIARDATLTLVDNLITADASMRHPGTDRAVGQVRIVHDLASAAGHADLIVDGLAFDSTLQPLDLSRLALGVVANVEGTVTGTGRIEWTATDLTSSGAFSSDSLDFAAAFGPVKGASGTIVFTDLLGLTTAPGQTIAVQSVNPGIEIYDGEIALQLQRGELLTIEGGTWPFLGGTLRMRPVALNLGRSEVRAYVMEIEGLEASQFIERMELNNLAATGTFDGTIPIIFDEMGNGRLEEGTLISRPPGGHVSYIGELTYEDMSPMANFAFDALRDLRYERMEIGMDGPLTGELVTRVRFDGVTQGETAQSNFITRRIARLPIRFLVTVRAPFYQLMTSIRAIYDPAAVRDPRSLGLLTDEGGVLRRRTDQAEVDARDEAAAEEAARQLRETSDDEPDIQPPESEAQP